MTPESPHLQMARTHLEDAQARIKRQQELIGRLVADGHEIQMAQTLLETMQSMALVMKEHVYQLEHRDDEE